MKTINSRGMGKQPFMIITDQNQFIPGDVLEQYSIKSQGESNQLTSDPFLTSYSENGLIAPLYDPMHLLTLSDYNTYHDIACETQALDITNTGWDLKPVGDNPSDDNYNHLIEFFKRVFEDNPFRKAQRDKVEVGYCAMEIVRYDDALTADIKDILHIPAHTIRVHKDGNRYCQIRGTEKVWFKKFAYEPIVSKETGNIRPEGTKLMAEEGTPATEVIWNVRYTSRSDYYGKPAIIPALAAMYANASLMTYNISFFENYGIPAYAVFITGNYKDELVDEDKPEKGTKLQKAVRDRFHDIQTNRHGTMVFSVPSEDESGQVEIRFEQLSVETKEASFRLYREDNRDEILTAHGMDPYRVGVTKTGALGGNFASIMRENYKSSVQVPEQQTWEQLINMIIRHKYGFDIQDWRFKFRRFDLSDKAVEIQNTRELFMMGVLTPNQIIRRYQEDYGLDEINHPAMDAHYINGLPVDYNVSEGLPEDVVKVLKRLREDITNDNE